MADTTAFAEPDRRRRVELALAQAQGEVGVHSTPGAGSTFWCERALDLAPGAPAARPPRVLLAEDNPVNQEVAAGLLCAMGVAVDVVGDGAQACARSAAGPYDLVLMDVQMPVMDGLRATAEIRRREAATGLPRVPIVAMTANAFDEDRDQCLAAGMDDHLAKPVEPRRLQQCLARWLPARPVADVEATLQARLAALPGLSLAQGLRQVHGEWPVYQRVLALFPTHHGGDVERLARLAAADDRTTLRQVAHALSGAAATLGAHRVHEHARALELALGAAPPGASTMAVQSLAAAAARALGDLLAALRPAAGAAVGGRDVGAAAPAAGAKGAVPVDGRAVRDCLQTLVPLLASHDTAACERIDQAAPLLRAAFGSLAQRLHEQIHHFDFEHARATLAQAIRQAEVLAD